MSAHQGRAKSGGKRTDDKDLSPETREKMRKNREAAKKHREKKVNTMKDLESRNKELETKNKDYIKQRETLQQKIKDYIKLFKKHLAAGCQLPSELESVWNDLMKESFLMEDDMDTSTQITNISNNCGDCSSVVNGGHTNAAHMGSKLGAQSRRVESSLSMSTSASSPADDSHSDISTPESSAATDSVIVQSLFSGAPLQTPTPTGRHHPYHGRRTPLQGRQSIPTLETTDQQGKRSAVAHSPSMNDSINGARAMVSMRQTQQGIVENQQSQLINLQMVQPFGSSHELGQNSHIAMAVDGEANISTSEIIGSPNGVTQHQNIDHSQTTPLNVEEECVSVLLDTGEIALVPRHMFEQQMNIQVQQIQPSQSVNVSEPAGNIPIPDLLGSFTDTYVPSENNKIEEPALKQENDVALNGNTGQEIVMKPAVVGQLSEVASYSYTNDLNQSETPQSILRRVQQEHHDLGQSEAHTMAQTMASQVSILSEAMPITNCSSMDIQDTYQYNVNPSNKQRLAFGEFNNVLHIKQASGHNPHTNMSVLVPQVQHTPPHSRPMAVINPSVSGGAMPMSTAIDTIQADPNTGFHSSVACAPAAVLDMLAKREVSPALQDQIKASFSQTRNTTISSSTSQTSHATTYYRVTGFNNLSGGNALVVSSNRDGSTRNTVEKH